MAKSLPRLDAVIARKKRAQIRGVRFEQANNLFIAELQFRLASAVRLATSLKTQPLDLPTLWSHGKHVVAYEEIPLRQDQAECAACFLQRSATYLMALSIKDAVRAVIPDPKNSADPNVRSAYQIARLIRNAFAHDAFEPKWSIDPDCRDKVFSVPDIAMLDTHGIDGEKFDWRHYGGLLAILRLCRFVRSEIIGDTLERTQEVPPPTAIIHQQGDLILRKVDRLPDGVKRIAVKRRKSGGISLGGGHFIG